MSVCVSLWSENTRNNTDMFFRQSQLAEFSAAHRSLAMSLDTDEQMCLSFPLPLSHTIRFFENSLVISNSTSAAHTKVCHSALCAVFSFLVCLEQTAGTFTIFCAAIYTPTLARKVWSRCNASTVLAAVPGHWWSTREKNLQLHKAALTCLGTQLHALVASAGSGKNPKPSKPTGAKAEWENAYPKSLRIVTLGKTLKVIKSSQ